jgi:phosphate transport system substrate-binding protein
MKIGIGRKRAAPGLMYASATLLFVLLLAGPALPARAADAVLRGEAFSDPAYRAPMPPEWLKKPITHEPAAAKADIAVTLDQAIYPRLLPLIREYAAKHGLVIAVSEGTCGISAGMLSRKVVDIGGYCCPAGKEDRLPGLRFHTLGIDALAILANPANPIDSLTTRQVRDIYRGRIYRWSELKTDAGAPGPAWPIRAIARLHCKLRPVHWRLILNSEKEFGPDVTEVGFIPDMISQVGAMRGSLGWEVLIMAQKYRNQGTVKTLKINGYAPTDLGAIASLRYPFYRVYNITTWEGPGLENPKAQKLVNYLLKEVETIDQTRYGFVPANRLRSAGWRFHGDELIGEPGKSARRK